MVRLLKMVKKKRKNGANDLNGGMLVDVPCGEAAEPVAGLDGPVGLLGVLVLLEGLNGLL